MAGVYCPAPQAERLCADLYLGKLCEFQEKIIAEVGKEKREITLYEISNEIKNEVESTEDAIIACENGADIVMFDNMSPQEAQDTLNALEEKDLRKDVLIEISGGITEDNILDYAPLDVDIISLGALTHQASSLNFSLDMD